MIHAYQDHHGTGPRASRCVGEPKARKSRRAFGAVWQLTLPGMAQSLAIMGSVSRRAGSCRARSTQRGRTLRRTLTGESFRHRMAGEGSTSGND